MRDKLTIAVMILAVVVAFFAGTQVGMQRAEAQGNLEAARNEVETVFNKVNPSLPPRARATLILAAVHRAHP